MADAALTRPTIDDRWSPNISQLDITSIFQLRIKQNAFLEYPVHGKTNDRYIIQRICALRIILRCSLSFIYGVRYILKDVCVSWWKRIPVRACQSREAWSSVTPHRHLRCTYFFSAKQRKINRESKALVNYWRTTRSRLDQGLIICCFEVSTMHYTPDDTATTILGTERISPNFYAWKFHRLIIRTRVIS